MRNAGYDGVYISGIRSLLFPIKYPFNPCPSCELTVGKVPINKEGAEECG